MGIVSYAQNLEDVVLWRALSGVERGFYIDVGANDPFTDSVTLAFYENGWRGINIEPLEAHYQDLLKHRPEDINLRCAAGPERGETQIWECDVRGWATAAESVVEMHRAGGHAGTYQTVPLRTLTDICAVHAKDEIHFLKIDVEGFEKQVIEGMDFGRFRPWIVVVEATLPNSTEPAFADWEPLLTQSSYSLAYVDGLNRFYLAHEHNDLRAGFAFPPNVFDGYTPSRVVIAEEEAHSAKTNAMQVAEQLDDAERRIAMMEQEAARARHIADEARAHALHVEGRVRQLESTVQLVEGRARNAEEEARKEGARAVQAECEVVRLDERVKGVQSLLDRADALAVQLELEKNRYFEEARSFAAKSEAAAVQLSDLRVEVAMLNQQALLNGQYLMAAKAEAGAHKDARNRLEEVVVSLNGDHAQLTAKLTAELERSAKAEVELAAVKDLLAGERALSEDKQREVDFWHERVLKLHASTSWQLTKPLRGFKRLMTREGSVARGGAGYGSHIREQMDQSARAFLAHGIRYVFLRPQLRRWLSRGLKKLPALHEGLLRAGVSAGAVALPPWMGPAALPTPSAFVRRGGSSGHSGKRVAVLAPGAANGVQGGAERLYSGLLKALKEEGCDVDFICLAFDESSFATIQEGYRAFSELDLGDYDLVVSTKAPTYVVNHPNHVLYLVHTVRVFYDMFDTVFSSPSEELLAQREWIHKADSEAFSRISKRFSIGAEVSQRMLRWNGADAEVLHPPMDVDGLYDSGIGDYLFMPGRLHPWKRVDLAIKAVKRSALPLRLLIAGTGEAELDLRELADGDDRIEFLGRVDDAQLKALYAGALAVPFLPLREDYGYVTLEAFASGKPVVTCTDSGEPTQFVDNDITGLLCEPDPMAICSAFEKLWNDRDLAKRLGKAGRERVAEIRWPAVAGRLLEAGLGSAFKRPERAAKRLRVAILDMQPIMPAVGGGRLRLLGLYHALGASIDARYVGSYDWPGEKYRRHTISPTLEEIDVPLTPAHHAAATEASQKADGKVVIDMLFGQQGHLSPQYLEEAVAAVIWAEVVVFSHPWVAPLISDDLLRDKTIVYDSQNVEKILRAQLLDESRVFQRHIAEEVERAERLVGDRADLILACSPEDAEGFVREYGWQRSAIAVVPNGVFGDAIRPPTLEQKRIARVALGLHPSRPVAFFIGSDYPPNVEAAQIIVKEIAPICPDVDFAVVGGVCNRLTAAQDKNVRLVGYVDDAQRAAWLHAADFALNPMCSGSGTNIKMFDFMASGLPVISTPIGARGITTSSTRGIRLAEARDTPAAIKALLECADGLVDAGRENRVLVEQQFSWEKISPSLGLKLRRVWMHKRGRSLLKSSSAAGRYKIAHLTTTGIKCGIGEYTKKIVDVFHQNGLENLVLNCNSAAEKTTPPDCNADFQVAWYFDNQGWRDSRLHEDIVKRLQDWRADRLLIQYHPAFYAPQMLLDLIHSCVAGSIVVAVVVHNYIEECTDVFKALNRLGVTIFSHRETEASEAREHGVSMEVIPLGVDMREPLIHRDTAERDFYREPPVIVTNGFLRKHKGPRLLVQSMPRILDVFPGAKLKIQCALYPSEDSREELAACKREIELLGLEGRVSIDTRFLEKTEVLNEMTGADVAVLPYENSNEGGSASATDAFAVGLPLIVSTADIFNDIRDITITCEPAAEDIARAVLTLLTSPDKYRFLAGESLAYAKRNSWANVAGSFLAAM